MNGHESLRLTTREAQEFLRDKAADQRAESKRKRDEQWDQRISTVILGAAFAIIAAIGATVIYAKPSVKSTDFVFDETLASWFHAKDGWFNPTYSLEVNPEWWQVGKHSYTTRDLMGRRI